MVWFAFSLARVWFSDLSYRSLINFFLSLTSSFLIILTCALLSPFLIFCRHFTLESLGHPFRHHLFLVLLPALLALLASEQRADGLLSTHRLFNHHQSVIQLAGESIGKLAFKPELPFSAFFHFKFCWTHFYWVSLLLAGTSFETFSRTSWANDLFANQPLMRLILVCFRWHYSYTTLPLLHLPTRSYVIICTVLISLTVGFSNFFVRRLWSAVWRSLLWSHSVCALIA